MFEFTYEIVDGLFVVKVEAHFDTEARTLNPEEVLENHKGEVGVYSRTHSDGWTIRGRIAEDYYYWINDFEAIHPVYGRVWGNFEFEVYADSKTGYELFVKNHPYQRWDYYDI